MEKVTVLHFKKFDIEQGINIQSKRRATRDLIARVRAEPLEDTAMELDEHLVDDEGFLTPAIFDWQERPSPHGKHDVEHEILNLLDSPPLEIVPCHDEPLRVAVVFTGPHEEAAMAKIECRCGNPLARLNREIIEGEVKWRWGAM